jgi:hypothetical protein
VAKSLECARAAAITRKGERCDFPLSSDHAPTKRALSLMTAVDAEIRPEPDPAEREALLAALSEGAEPDRSPYRSAWRTAADENDEGYEAIARPRSSRGATRA